MVVQWDQSILDDAEIQLCRISMYWLANVLKIVLMDILSRDASDFMSLGSIKCDRINRRLSIGILKLDKYP